MDSSYPFLNKQYTVNHSPAISSAQRCEFPLTIKNCSAYYPTGLPTEEYKSSTNVLLHLTDTHAFGPPPGTKSRVYYGTRPGFAEPGNINYDPINAAIAYSRTLAALRSIVGPKVDLEDVWDDNINYRFVEKKIDKMLETMVDEPLVNHVRLNRGLNTLYSTASSMIKITLIY